MPTRPPEFDKLAEALKPVLAGFPPKIIAIDGRSFAGKTTLGRFLAWYFNSTLLELDLFLAEGGLVHRYEEIERIVKQRLDGKRPVFVEGITVLNVLRKIGRTHDYLIYVRNPKYPNGAGFGKELTEYDKEFVPASKADYLLEGAHDG